MRAVIGRFLILAFCLLVAPSPLRAQPSSEVPPEFESTWDNLTADFRQSMKEDGHVGGTLWLASEGKVLEKEYYGFANLESERRIDDETIYHWASITKTFTGVAIMQLRDRGLLSLDDPVVSYLPSLREVHNPYRSMENITMRRSRRGRPGSTPRRPECWPRRPGRWGPGLCTTPRTTCLTG